jgi:hypothetical protein
MLAVISAALTASAAAAPPALPLCNVTAGMTRQPNPINLTRCGASGCPDLCGNAVLP